MPMGVTTQSMRVPVELSLEQALNQVESLRKILNESVKPDSAAYRELNKLLEKASQQATGFRQNMGEALKTSSGSKKFTSDLQKTFNLLDVITERMSEVRGKDLLFDENDTKRIEDARLQISNINDEIKALRTKKIGSFFDDNSVAEFKQIRDFANKTGLELNKITFADLQRNLTRELDKVNSSIDDSTKKIKAFDNVINNTDLNDLNKLTQSLNTSASGAIGDVFSSDWSEALKKLNEFYNQFPDYIGRINHKIKEGSSVSDFLKTESQDINANINVQLANLQNYKKELTDALADIKNAYPNKKGNNFETARAMLKTQKMQDLLKSVGFNEVLGDTDNPYGFMKRASQAIESALNKTDIKTENLKELQTKMLDAITHVFDGIDTSSAVLDKTKFKSSISNLLKSFDIDPKDLNIQKAFQDIDKGMDASSAIARMREAVTQYIAAAKEAKAVTEQESTAQQQYAVVLQQSSDIVGQAEQDQERQVQGLVLNQQQLYNLINQIIAAREADQRSLKGENTELEKNKQQYESVIQELNKYTAAQIKSEKQMQALGNIKTAIANWMGFSQVLNITKRALSEAINHIKQLDTTMNGIAIVTDMTTADLWKQVGAYSEMAQNFGVTIQGAYEVSKIYYQAGYDTNEVLTLTNETLKLSKISGLDYATTTDYMMTAMRGFKLEMEDASRVVDVYSNLAANTAVSQQELAEAMTRTASSMESVGATFEETSAMIATMVAVTRESANNIGSAMKSIASRYGELTKDPAALFDADGEAMSFNKVDAALRSVGITMQTVDHQFRDFTDVIIELAEKWDTLDSTSQRYIATQFAGNRQQSRFLALVSNVELLKQNLANAENSEDVGTLQALKSLDSLESKINQVQVAYQQFYTTIGIENVWKNLLDSTTNVIDTLNGLPKLFDTIPVNALAMVGTVINLVKTFALNGFSSLVLLIKGKIKQAEQEITAEVTDGAKRTVQEVAKAAGEQVDKEGPNLTKKIKNLFNKKNIGDTISTIGSLGVTLGAVLDKSTRSGQVLSGVITGIGGAAQSVGNIVNAVVSHNPLGAVLAVATGILNIINGISLAIETSEEKLERLTKEAEELSNEAKKAKAEYNTLDRTIQKIKDLEVERYNSIEATEEYNNAINELADSFPQLVIGLDDAGNAIINMENAEVLLADARRQTAEATLKAIKGEKARQEADLANSVFEATKLLNNSVSSAGEYSQGNPTTGFTVGKTKYRINNDTVGLINTILGEIDENNYVLDNNSGNNIERFVNNLDEINRVYHTFDNATILNIPDIEQFKTDLDSDNQFNQQNALLTWLEKYANSENRNLYNKDIQNDILALNDALTSYHEEYQDNFLEQFFKENSSWQQLIQEIYTIREQQLVLPNTEKLLISQELSSRNDILRDNSSLNQLTTNLLVSYNKEDLTDQDYINATNTILNWWNALEENQDAAKEIFSNLSKYTLENIYDKLGIEVSKDTEDIRTAFESYYISQVTDVSDQIKNQISKVALGESVEQGKFNTQTGLKLVTEAVNLVQQYHDTAGLNINSYKIWSNFIRIFNTLAEVQEESVDTFIELENLFSQGFSSKEDISKIIDYLKENFAGQDWADSLINYLNNVSNEIITNYYITLTDTIDKNSERYSSDIKTFDKIIDGFDPKEFYEFLNSSLAKSLGLTLNNFKLIDGKYQLADENFNFADQYSAYLQEFYNLPDGVEENVFERLETDLSDAEQVALGLTGLDESERTKRINELKELYALYQNQLSTFETLFIENSKKKLKERTEKRYSALLSAYFAKDKDISSNYSDIVDENTLNNINKETIRAWAEKASKTAEEVNEEVLKYIESERNKGQEIAKEVNFLSDKIAYASSETLTKLAELLGKNVEILFNASTYSKALGGYQINSKYLKELQQYNDIITDSTIEHYKDIANFINKGLSGSLSNEEFTNLGELLSAYRVNVDLAATQTADGLKIATDQAIILYDELYKVDSLAANMVADELVKSLTAAGEVCENISKTQAAINDLQKKINDSDQKDNRILETRLSLYKRIQQQQQLTNPNSYKFMDRNVSDGEQGALNYWNAADKAMSVLKKSAQTGYMDYEDYYNIISEIVNTSEDLEFAGQQFNTRTEMFNKLMIEGQESLTMVSGEGVKVSLKNLGSDFKFGVDEMSTEIESGIKAFAAEQVKVLDAEIQFLEGIVALNSLTKQEEPFSIDDVFDTEGNKEFSETYKNFVEEFKKSTDVLNGIEINKNNKTYTLLEILTDYKTALDAFGNEDAFVSFINSIRAALLSDDFSPENLPFIMQQLAEGKDLDLTVTVDTEFKADTEAGQELLDEGKSEAEMTVQVDTPKKGLFIDSTSDSSNEANEKEEKIKVTLEYNPDSPAGLKELLEAIGVPLDRVASITANDVDIPVDLTGDFDNLTLESGKYTIVTTDGKKITIETDIKDLQSSPLSETEDGSKVYTIKTESGKSISVVVETEGMENSALSVVENSGGKIYTIATANGKKIQIQVDNIDDAARAAGLTSDGENYTVPTTSGEAIRVSVIGIDESAEEEGLIPNGKVYTILTGAADPIIVVTDTEILGLIPSSDGGYTLETSTNTVKIDANVGEIVGLQGNSQDGYTLLLASGEEIKIPAQVDEHNVVGLQFNGDGYVLKLGNGEELEVSATVVKTDGLTGDNTTGYSLKIDNDVEITPTLNTTQLDKDLKKWLEENPVEYTPTNPNPPPTNHFGNNNNNSNNTNNNNNNKTLEDSVKELETAKMLVEAGELTVNSPLTSTNDTTATEQEQKALEDAAQAQEKNTKKVEDSTNIVDNSSTSVTRAGNSASRASAQLSSAANSAGKVVNAFDSFVNEFRIFGSALSRISEAAGSLKHNPNTVKQVGGARGNVALSHGRNTLMGELGPELWVSGGHYYVAGQNGPEFVRLPDDAIVFNHLQTQKLLHSGQTSVHGTPVTNERKAVSFAAGTTGPAKASAQQVLEDLKRLRTMWQTIAEASFKDLGGLAGGGGGGGGGGKQWQQKTTSGDIQRWYNLLRQIAKLEKDITYEESLQSKLESDRVINGKAIYQSYKRELDYLDEEISKNQELAKLQRDWYDVKRKELEESDYGKIFTYNEYGLQQLAGSGAPGSGLGLDILENLNRRDVYGQAVDNAATAEAQLNYLKSIGFNIDNLKYNGDGTTIELEGLKGEERDNALVQLMENFWTTVDSWRDELDGIYDSYNEQLENVLSNEEKRNELLQKVIDNQLSVEQDVLKAIENREQKRIDDMKDMREALGDSVDKMIDGLGEELDRERDMYQRAQSQDDLNKLRRQLAILQRSGGSSSQIRNLQQQIDAKTQDAYFQAQQDQIDTLQKASDAQLERLDAQIDIMTEALEYQRENGLLWNEVYQIMSKTPEQIQDFIINNTPDFQSNSALQVAEDLRELRSKIEQWVEYRKDAENGNNITDRGNGWDTYYESTKYLYDNVDDKTLTNARNIYNATLAATGDPNAATRAAEDLIANYRKKPAATTNTNTATTTVSTSSGSSGSKGSSSGSKSSGSSGNLTIGSRGKAVEALQSIIQRVISPHFQVDGIFGEQTAKAIKILQRINGLTADGIVGPATRKVLRDKYGYSYKEGGLVEHTGLVMVHGSKTKPEAFLNAKETKLWKEEILSGNKGSLANSLISLNNAIQQMAEDNTFTTNNTNGGINIEQLDFNMNATISNDYDARRAGQTALEEMVRIARQTSVQSITRR